MQDFSIWVIFREATEQLVPASILRAYEDEFKRGLESLIQRTTDPVLRSTFQRMMSCPVLDLTGRCRGFAEYVLSALIKHGVHYRFDIESSLSYVISKMLMNRGDSGEPRATLFTDFDETRPYTPGFNPLQTRFFSWLKFALGNVVRGKIPRLLKIQQPARTVNIGLGRARTDEPGMGISPEQLPARQSTDADVEEMIEDITTLLRQKQPAYPINLVALWKSMIAGDTTERQRKRFGDRLARIGRSIILDTIQSYAESTGNLQLRSLLDRFRGNESPARRTLAKPSQPRLAPGPAKDFGSVLAVIDWAGGGPVGTARLGSARRRWLSYPPRDPSGGYRNRLEEVLAKAVEGNVLTAHRTKNGALVYSLGPNADQYRLTAVEWLEESDKKLYRDIIPEADQVLQIVAGAGHLGIRRRELGKALPKLPRQTLDDLLSALAGSGQISVVALPDGDLVIRAPGFARSAG